MPTPVANLVSGILVTLVVFMDTEIRVGDGGGEGKILLHCGWSGSSFLIVATPAGRQEPPEPTTRCQGHRACLSSGTQESLSANVRTQLSTPPNTPNTHTHTQVKESHLEQHIMPHRPSTPSNTANRQSRNLAV